MTNETQHLTGPCQRCGNAIEFTSDQVDTAATCPHCGNETLLSPNPDLVPATQPRSRALPIILIVSLMLLVAAGATAIFLKQKSSSNATQAPATNSPPAPIPVATQTSTNKPPKSINDLKVGEIKLEKTKGSSLVYAVATLKNDSEYQRFGVRVELNLFDRRGTNVGIAKDYTSVIEPHQDWHFRALAPDSKTVTAQLATIKEDE